MRRGFALALCERTPDQQHARFFDVDEIQKVVVLSIFVPAIISSGATLVAEFDSGDPRSCHRRSRYEDRWWRVIRLNELVVAVMLGLIIGSLELSSREPVGADGLVEETHTDAAGKVIVDSSVPGSLLRLAAAISVQPHRRGSVGAGKGAPTTFGLKKNETGSGRLQHSVCRDARRRTGIIITSLSPVVILRAHCSKPQTRKKRPAIPGRESFSTFGFRPRQAERRPGPAPEAARRRLSTGSRLPPSRSSRRRGTAGSCCQHEDITKSDHRPAGKPICPRGLKLPVTARTSPTIADDDRRRGMFWR